MLPSNYSNPNKTDVVNHVNNNKTTPSNERFHILTDPQRAKLIELLATDMYIHPQGPNAHMFPTLVIKLSQAIECVRDKLHASDIGILDIRVNGGAASYIINQDLSAESTGTADVTADILPDYEPAEVQKVQQTFNDLDLIYFVKLNTSRDMERIKSAVLEMLYSLFVNSYHDIMLKQQQQDQQRICADNKRASKKLSKNVRNKPSYSKDKTVADGSKYISADNGNETLVDENTPLDVMDVTLVTQAAQLTSKFVAESSSPDIHVDGIRIFPDTPVDPEYYSNNEDPEEEDTNSSVFSLETTSPTDRLSTADSGTPSSTTPSTCDGPSSRSLGSVASSGTRDSGLVDGAGDDDDEIDQGATDRKELLKKLLLASPAPVEKNAKFFGPTKEIAPNLLASGPVSSDNIVGTHCYINRSILREVYIHKMVKVCSSGDLWSLIALSNKDGRNLEFKFVSSMKRQFEFSVDSFQIILDPLLTPPKWFLGSSSTKVSPAKSPTSPTPEDVQTADIQAVEVICESVFGDFAQAQSHLAQKLIATIRPEEIRGGGLLKYCHLIVQGFTPEHRDGIKSLEKYMCSRFFIDFGDLQKQRVKLDSYLRNHFFKDPHSLYNYLLTLYKVVDESTVCLMGHERREILKLIEKLFYDVYYNVYGGHDDGTRFDHGLMGRTASNMSLSGGATVYDNMSSPSSISADWPISHHRPTPCKRSWGGPRHQSSNNSRNGAITTGSNSKWVQPDRMMNGAASWNRINRPPPPNTYGGLGESVDGMMQTVVQEPVYNHQKLSHNLPSSQPTMASNQLIHGNLTPTQYVVSLQPYQLPNMQAEPVNFGSFNAQHNNYHAYPYPQSLRPPPFICNNNNSYNGTPPLLPTPTSFAQIITNDPRNNLVVTETKPVDHTTANYGSDTSNRPTSNETTLSNPLPTAPPPSYLPPAPAAYLITSPPANVYSPVIYPNHDPSNYVYRHVNNNNNHGQETAGFVMMSPYYPPTASQQATATAYVIQQASPPFVSSAFCQQQQQTSFCQQQQQQRFVYQPCYIIPVIHNHHTSTTTNHQYLPLASAVSSHNKNYAGGSSNRRTTIATQTSCNDIRDEQEELQSAAPLRPLKAGNGLIGPPSYLQVLEAAPASC